MIDETSILPELTNIIKHYYGTDIRKDVKQFKINEFVFTSFSQETISNTKNIEPFNDNLGIILERQKVDVIPERYNEYRYVVLCYIRQTTNYKAGVRILYLYSDDIRKLTDIEFKKLNNLIVHYDHYINYSRRQLQIFKERIFRNEKLVDDIMDHLTTNSNINFK